jgi:hypothetical protein
MFLSFTAQVAFAAQIPDAKFLELIASPALDQGLARLGFDFAAGLTSQHSDRARFADTRRKSRHRDAARRVSPASPLTRRS